MFVNEYVWYHIKVRYDELYESLEEKVNVRLRGMVILVICLLILYIDEHEWSFMCPGMNYVGK